MKKLILILLISKIALGQNFSESDYQIGLLNSSINVQHLIDGSGFLDQDFKNNFIQDLNDQNHLFFNQNYNLRYKNDKGWGIGFKNNLFFNLNYSKDLFRLAFYGNGNFLDQELNLSPLEFQFAHYSQLYFEQQFNSNFSTSFSFVMGHQLAQFEINKGIFKTGQYGSSIEYDIDLEAHISDTSNLNPVGINGYGFAIGASYTDTSKSNTIFYFQLSDLGIIRWNNNTTNIETQSDFFFEGIEINDLSDLNDSIITNQIDKIANDLDKEVKDIYHYRIPFRLQAKLDHPLKTNFINEVSFGLEYINTLYPKPRWLIEVHRDLKKHRFSLGYHLGGLEHPGFEFAYKFKGNKTHFKLYTKQANYFINNQIYGVHFGVSFKRILKSK